MSLARLQAKLERLGRLAARPGADDPAALAQTAHEALSDGPAFLTMTTTLRGALELDLVYALVRHRAWVRAVSFREALAGFLSSEYRLAASSARELVDAVAGVPVAADTDQGHQFLRYVFVLTATTSDEAELALDLGLGEGLIAGLKRAIAGASAVSSEAPAYAGGLDQAVRTVMIELAELASDSPLALDGERLRYALFEASAASAGEPVVPDDAETAATFAVLLELSRKKKRPKAKLAASGVDFEKLRRAGLVYGDATLELALSGQELVAAAHADEIVATGITLDAKRLAGLPPATQARLIAVHPDMSVEALTSLAAEPATLSPRALEAVVGRLAREAPAEVWSETRQRLEGAALPVWLAGAAQRALAEARR